MTTAITESQRPWDLTHVLDLVNTLSPKAASTPLVAGQDVTLHDRLQADPFVGRSANQEDDYTTGGVKLGDFSRVWQFLGTPKHISQSSGAEYASSITLSKLDYASDGAAYKSRHTSQSRAAHSSEGTDGETHSANDADDTPLTKTQKKRARRKERKTLQQAINHINLTDPESEADTKAKRTPATKASTHVVTSAPAARPSLREREASIMANRASTVTKSASTKTTIQNGKTPEPESRQSQLGPSQLGGKELLKDTNTARKYFASVASAERSRLRTSAAASTLTSTETVSTSDAVKAVANATASIKKEKTSGSPSVKTFTPSSKQQRAPETPVRRDLKESAVHSVGNPQVITRSATKGLELVPSSVQPVLNGKALTPKQALTRSESTHVSLPVSNPTNIDGRQRPVIEPKIVRSGEDRHWALLMKIIGDFYEDRKHLLNPMNLTTHNNDPHGIHVFVDASNIFIGFMDQLKRSRNIHPLAHVPQAHLSFDALALLMERRRPVAKRVLVGSTPHLPAFDKAEAVGYECSILEKVYKARELTDRQIYFRDLDARRSGRSPKVAPPPNRVALPSVSSPSVPQIGNGSGSGSGSETNTPQYAPARMIEQGVDEILHLKMLESIVDFEVPSTVVLATGDAAAAEYSPGFMAMVHRALKKGWRVELVSWSKNISAMYTKKQWMESWGERFRIVYLDDYAEELLDM